MTVAVQALPITYNGNGTAAPLAVPFRFLAANHLVVTRVAADGARTVLVRGTHYSVSGGGEAPSGTVTPLAPIAVGDKWEIDRVTPREQPTAYPVGDDFPAKTHELALDRQMLVAQEQDRRAKDIETRAPLALPGQSAPSFDVSGLAEDDLLIFKSGRLRRWDRTAFAGKYVAGGPGGIFVPSAGLGGGDLSLRSDLANPTIGALLTAWKRSGLGAVLRTLYARLHDLPISVKDFGAVGNGIADDSAAFNLCCAIGGDIVAPPGIYNVDDRVLMNTPKTRLLLNCAWISGNPWTYPGAQLPFGAAVLVTAPHCSIIGSGMGQSGIALKGGSEANGVTFLHTDGGYLGNLTLDGGMDEVTAVADDTFMTGVNVLNALVANPSVTPSKVVVENVESRHWAQYGMQAYGDGAQAHFERCWVHHNGIADQPTSRGSAIAITRGNRGIFIVSCLLEDNKQDGILGTSAGLDSENIVVDGNIIRKNKRWGITWSEETNLASVSGVGTRRLSITNNIIEENGGGSFDGTGGVRIGTYNNVGLISMVNSQGNLITESIGYGYLIQTNDHPTNRVSNVSIDDIIKASTIADIGIGLHLEQDVFWNAAKVGTVTNFGDSKLHVNVPRGWGGTIASAETVTFPKGDIVTITGTETIENITVGDYEREVTVLSAGTPVFANTGNIVVGPTNLTLPGNSAATFKQRGSSWFCTAVRINA